MVADMTIGGFQYLEAKGRAVVKRRPLSRGKHKNGAYIGVPKPWKGRRVRLTLENSDEQPEYGDVVGTTSFIVSAPDKWVGKSVLVEVTGDAVGKQATKPACTSCGSTEFQERGSKKKAGKIMKQAKCKACGKFFLRDM